MSQTEAQAEFQQLVDKSSQGSDEDRHLHPEDRLAFKQEAASTGIDDVDEEEQYRVKQIDAAMRMPSHSAAGADTYGYNLPPASFDSGRATGVKGVIADARNYELARKATFMNRVRSARRSVFGLGHVSNDSVDNDKKSDLSSEEDEDEESFLAQWRDSRRRELEGDARPGAHIRTRRTSPSVRLYGRLDSVDALGYLDAIEKVGRETVVVVFVYDDECQVSSAIEQALRPLVSAFPAVHFVKVHYDDIEFDNAAVPAILAYRNQGDLFANLTGLIEMLPGEDKDDDDAFSSENLQKLLHSKDIL
ncbi:phosducin [Sporothrix brasiliensis 5110]|uniref:Phosducin n=1 Tax=Sporothrix brasiliensis 5110 TaxID=1398154 RepID=A0A0C2IZL2_9PEZI|nr:phosducin [Sporothrix brasiliensis 5110]KIH92155.1 phosducin [Sporothrix brasiliensis 5110]